MNNCIVCAFGKSQSWQKTINNGDEEGRVPNHGDFDAWLLHQDPTCIPYIKKAGESGFTSTTISLNFPPKVKLCVQFSHYHYHYCEISNILDPNILSDCLNPSKSTHTQQCININLHKKPSKENGQFFNSSDYLQVFGQLQLIHVGQWTTVFHSLSSSLWISS